MMRAIFLAIPAPGSGDEPWGRRFRLYGIMIAIGVLAALEMARRRWQARGGDPEDMSTLVLWVVPAGLIGARIYHLVTDRATYAGQWFANPFGPGDSPLAFWRGGLGIPGGLLVGFVVGAVVAKRKGMRIGPVADAIAPGVPLAQAIGRFGNYFNQELYGGPTDLPWGLEVSRPPAQYAPGTTFHPTFLYESLWNVGLMFVLLWIDKHRPVRPGRLFILYVGGYFTGRLWVEAIRIDPALTHFLGVRVNIWTSLAAIATVAVVLAFIGLWRRPGDDDRPYVDGHPVDPERGLVPPPEPGTDGGPSDVPAPPEGSVPDVPAPPEGSVPDVPAPPEGSVPDDGVPSAAGSGDGGEDPS